MVEDKKNPCDIVKKRCLERLQHFVARHKRIKTKTYITHRTLPLLPTLHTSWCLQMLHWASQHLSL